MDFKVLSKLNKQRSYALVAIDRATRFVWVKIIARRDAATTATCLREFLDAFPHPVHTLLTDNDGGFTDRFAVDKKNKPQGKPSGTHLFDQVCRAHHIEHRLIRPFRPQTNGMVERFNRRLSEALRSRPQIKSNWSTNRFHNHEERNQFIYTFVENYNRTRLKCLGYKSPKEVLSNQTEPNTTEELTEQLNEQVLPQVFLKLADVGSRLIADRLSAGAIVGGGTISSQAHDGEAGSSGLMAQLGQWLSGDAAEVELSRRLQNLDDFELRDFIDDLSFAAAGEQVGMAGGSLYGIGNYTRLSGDEDGVDWDGDLYSGYVGLDKRLRNGALAGVLLSYSKGEFEYADAVGVKGEYDLDISSVNPYVGWSLSDDLDIWASVGYGVGEVELNDNGEPRSSDLSVGSVSVGASGRLVVSDELIAGGRSELHLRGDGSASQVDFDRSDAGFTDVSSHRLRLIVEASHLRSGASGSVRSGLELGVRHDGGDGQDDQGLELGGSLEWSNTRGLTLSGRTRVLTLADYDEWGVSGILRLAPGQGGRGLSFSLSPGYGRDDSGTEQLWQRGASAVSSAQTARLRMDGEVGYGLWLLGGTVQPYAGASLLQGGGSTQRMGARLELGRGVQLGLEGSRAERTSADAEHRIELQWQWNW